MLGGVSEEDCAEDGAHRRWEPETGGENHQEPPAGAALGPAPIAPRSNCTVSWEIKWRAGPQCAAGPRLGGCGVTTEGLEMQDHTPFLPELSSWLL